MCSPTPACHVTVAASGTNPNHTAVNADGATVIDYNAIVVDYITVVNNDNGAVNDDNAVVVVDGGAVEGGVIPAIARTLRGRRLASLL